MTTYTISESNSVYVFGVIDTLVYLEQFSIKTLWDILDKHCGDAKGEFIYAVQELNSLEIIDKWYKIVNDDEYVECKEDEADDVEVIDKDGVIVE
jgi:hypothetical protein